MEIALGIMLGIGLVEGAFLCFEVWERNELLKANNLLIDTMNKAQELEKKSRRQTDGTFSDPLGDRYRKNKDGLYRPIKPFKFKEEGDGDEDI